MDALRARASKEANVAAAAIEHGRRIILTCGITLLVLQLAVAAIGYLVVGASGLVLEAVRIAFVGGAISALYSGFRWARRWLQFASFFAAFLSLRMIAIGAQSEAALFVYSGAILLVGYCVVFAYITFSSQVSRYMDA